ncbi:hypothetical protein [Mesorhizobium sp. AR07]|nr:hypothetical protein [Mesorhizobium sp. AR07]
MAASLTALRASTPDSSPRRRRDDCYGDLLNLDGSPQMAVK